MIVKRGKIGELSKRVKVGFVGTCEKYYTDNKTYPMIRTTNLSETGINYSDMKYVTEEFFAKNKKSQLHDGDVLIARFGTSGTACVYHGGNAQCLNAIIVEPDLDTTIPEYLAIVINSRNVREQVNKRIVGSTQAILNTKVLSDIEIELPSKQEQKKIVDIIYSIRYISKQRTMELKKLDDLIKARFVEMFGDPVINPLRWEQVTLKDVAKGKLSYGSGASATDFDGNLRYIRITDITENGDLNSDSKSPDQFDEKYLLGDGDILFARSGATVGKTFCYAEMKYGKAIYAGYLIRMIPDTSKVLPVYVFYYTKTEYYASFVANAQRAVAQPNINAQEYGDLTICVPPMELQEQFAAFVSQVDKSKVVVNKALNRAQLLFDSLMQQYFG